MIIVEQDYARYVELLDGLCHDANARFVFLLDRAGQQIASSGDLSGVDPTALASLVAGNVAATEGVAQIVGEAGFTSAYNEGPKESLHISTVSSKVILLVVFDERSSLGLVRLRVEQQTPALAEVADAVNDRQTKGSDQNAAAGSILAEITEDDIDALFG